MEENQVHIPEGWISNNLGNLCSEIRMGETLIFKDLTGSGIPVFSANTENRPWGFTNLNRLIFSKGTIVIGARGSIGFPRLPNSENFTCTQTTIAITPKNDFDSDFLFHQLKALDFSDITSQQAVPMLTTALTSKIKILLPNAKTEQTQIATILSKVDEAIAQTEQLIAKYTRIKTGLMQDLLTKGIDEHGNIRSEATHEFKDSPLGRIPKEWEWSLIGDACYVTKLAGYEFTKYMEYRDDGEVIALRALNIKNEKLILDDVQRISQKVSDFLIRSKLNKGDVLITYIGAYIGDIVQIQENNKYHLAPNIAKIVAGKKLNSDFLENMLRSERVQAYFKSLITTTANPSLTMGQIRKSYILFPNDIEEQKRISLKIKTMKNSINALSMALNKLQSLKMGLMQDLLSGKVRVNHLIKETASV